MIRTALFAGLSVSIAAAQSQATQTVIATTRDGASLKAPASFRAAVFPLNISPHTIKICLENQAAGYLKVEIIDLKGNKLHKPLFVFEPKGIIKYNMKHIPSGKYLVKINNTIESQVFEVTLSNKVIPVLEVKKGILAKME